MKELTKLEEMVMIAIWKLGDQAYGVEIKNKVKEIAGKEYFYNTLYTTFHQLVQKDYITKHFGEPTAVRGGKRKVFFQLTKKGKKILEVSFERQSQIWDGITKKSFKKGPA
jgi:DNA-binding PadR family transcriptional regulator